MTLFTKSIAASIIVITALVFSAFIHPDKKTRITSYQNNKETGKPAKQKIQAAILLDVSNSMDGLIVQAKEQLWNMVSTMGKVQCSNNETPDIEIALYEYGRTSNDAKRGYVKQINSFISNLDSLSENLFALTTNGGDEYCGQVIYTSIDELAWDNNPNSYKVIFIAGNEDFLQGNLHYTKACNSAKDKGVIVNTIYCGDKMQGIREHWNLNAECGNGSYTNINQNAREEDIPTPYDSLLITMNGTLNNTYLSYNYYGVAAQTKQVKMDALNSSAGKKTEMKRIAAKANSKVYKNGSWDLVDADEDGKLDDILKDRKELPDSLKNKTKEEIKAIINEKAKQRSVAQKEIVELNAKRDAFIAEERKRRANTKQENTLETEVEKIIKEQVKRSNMNVKD